MCRPRIQLTLSLQDVTHQCHHVENKSIEVKIKNQPFTPYETQDSTGNEWTINLYYNLRIKGSFSEDWIELYSASDGYPQQLIDSDHTVISYILGEDTDTVLGTKMINFPDDSHVDFQVEAMIGYVHREVTVPVPGTGWLFTGETSGWSETQTTIIHTSTEPETNSASQTLLLGLLIGTVATSALIGAGLLLYFTKRKRKIQQPP